jgi:hypothetical protein
VKVRGTLPGVSLTVKIERVCLSNPLDHNSSHAMCPELPEYSSNQEQDSYRAFRSNHLKISVSMETKLSWGMARGERPKLNMFSYMRRWFENLKFIFSVASKLHQTRCTHSSRTGDQRS